MENNALPATLFNINCGEILCGRSHRYQIFQFLGQGTFGKVARCIILDTGDFVALKIIRIDGFQGGIKEAKTMGIIRKLDPNKNNLLNAVEYFMHKNHFCIVYELLDTSLYDYMYSGGVGRLHLSEIRVIAQQLLVALKALKSINMVHGDIKPDNIMLVNHQSEPFKVKLIDFGLATKAPNMWKEGVMQNLAFRPPEVLLKHPNLDEGVDMWSLGCVLAILYLGYGLFPYKGEYEAMQTIVQLRGMPSNDVLDTGFHSDRFFDLVEEGAKRMWLLKSPEDYTLQTGVEILEQNRGFCHFFSLNDLQREQPENAVPVVRQDTMAFISLLKQMLEVDPQKRITPSEALRHNFLTMNHFPVASNNLYVLRAKEMMSKFHVEEENSVSDQLEQENGRISEGHGSEDHKGVNAANLNSKTSNDMPDHVAAPRKEESLKASGSSEKLAVRNKTNKASPNKEKLTSEKEQKYISKDLDEVSSCVEDVAPGDQENSSKSKTNQDRSPKVEVTSVPVTGTKVTNVTPEKLAVSNRTPQVTSTTSVLKPGMIAEQGTCENVVLRNEAFEVISCEEKESTAITVIQDQQEETATEVTGTVSINEVKPHKKWFKRICKFFRGFCCILPKENEDN